jgi:hypothetical protein
MQLLENSNSNVTASTQLSELSSWLAGWEFSQNIHGTHVSRSPQADCCRTKSEVGKAEERLESSY